MVGHPAQLAALREIYPAYPWDLAFVAKPVKALELVRSLQTTVDALRAAAGGGAPGGGGIGERAQVVRRLSGPLRKSVAPGKKSPLADAKPTSEASGRMSIPAPAPAPAPAALLAPQRRASVAAASALELPSGAGDGSDPPPRAARFSTSAMDGAGRRRSGAMSMRQAAGPSLASRIPSYGSFRLFDLLPPTKSNPAAARQGDGGGGSNGLGASSPPMGGTIPLRPAKAVSSATSDDASSSIGPASPGSTSAGDLRSEQWVSQPKLVASPERSPSQRASADAAVSVAAFVSQRSPPPAAVQIPASPGSVGSGLGSDGCSAGGVVGSDAGSGGGGGGGGDSGAMSRFGSLRAMASSPEKLARAATLHVLVVDDVPMNLRVAASILRKIGVKSIRTEENGEAAAEAVKATAFDIVFMARSGCCSFHPCVFLE